MRVLVIISIIRLCFLSIFFGNVETFTIIRRQAPLPSSTILPLSSRIIQRRCRNVVANNKRRRTNNNNNIIRQAHQEDRTITINSINTTKNKSTVSTKATKGEKEEENQDENVHVEKEENFSELIRPPSYLESLSIGETCYPFGGLSLSSITRLSSEPNIFLIRNTLSEHECNTLIDSAKDMEKAELYKESLQIQGYRSNSFISWIYPPDEEEEDEEDFFDIACNLVRMGSYQLLRNSTYYSELFLNWQNGYIAEPIQLLKYTKNGKFNLHHDGLGRIITMITYLNGIGGTWFPYANVNNNINNNDDDDSTFKKKMLVPGQDGLLIVGNEYPHHDDYYQEEDTNHNNNNNIIRINAGDSIVFYNYYYCCDDNNNNNSRIKMNIKSIHCGIRTITSEKWIATNWYRSKALHNYIETNNAQKEEDQNNNSGDWNEISTIIESFYDHNSIE